MSNKGFTLIEITAVIIILTIVAAIGGRILLEAFRAGHASRDAINAGWQTRLALYRMANELREADAISAAHTNNITFRDINDDVTYALLGSDITRNNIKVADSIASLNFTYFNANNQKTAVLKNMRCVNIAAQIISGSNPINVETMVCPRNFLW